MNLLQLDSVGYGRNRAVEQRHHLARPIQLWLALTKQSNGSRMRGALSSNSTIHLIRHGATSLLCVSCRMLPLPISWLTAECSPSMKDTEKWLRGQCASIYLASNEIAGTAH